VLLALLGEYRARMHQFAAMTNLAVWYSHMDVEAAMKELQTGVSAAVRKRAEANVAKARTRDSLQAFNKLTRVVGGQRRIISDPPLVQPIEELFEGIERDQILDFPRAVIRSYRRTLPSDRRHLLEAFRLADVARKVVGVGSVGTRAWIVLMLGRDDTDPLFLQAKEAEASVLEEFVGRSDRRSHGERVVHGQHLMQASSDIFLGWDHAQGYEGVERDFYVRQLRDWKGAALVDTMTPATMPSTPACVPARWSGPTPAPATVSPSPLTSAPVTPSTGPSSNSPRRTPTKTTATTTPSSKPKRTAASPHNTASNPTSTPRRRTDEMATDSHPLRRGPL
jgi:Uncharacterized protein conserved in bacteria (DUF2252)